MMQPSQMAIMIKAFSHRLHTYRITSLHWVNTRPRMEKERKNVNVRWIYLKRFFQANQRYNRLLGLFRLACILQNHHYFKKYQSTL